MIELPPLPDQRRKTRSAWPVAIVLVTLIITGGVLLVFHRLETWPGRMAAQGTAQLEQVGRDLRATFVDIAHLQPRITIRDRVIFEQTTQTAELATVTRRVEVEHEFLHTWVGSTKRIQLRGVFVVKAGFDLHQDFLVDVGEKEIKVQLPAAQILGVEEQQVEVLAFENGFWNPISSADLETELSTLPKLAKEKAQASHLVEEAEVALKQELEQRIQTRQPIQVTFRPVAASR